MPEVLVELGSKHWHIVPCSVGTLSNKSEVSFTLCHGVISRSSVPFLSADHADVLHRVLYHGR